MTPADSIGISTHTLARLLAGDTPVPATPGGPVRVIGIDLGTTNSVVAEIVWEPGCGQPPVVRCLEVEQETELGDYVHTLVPSVVAVAHGKVWVGEGAKRLRANAKLRRNRDVFYECKNEMGVRRTYHLAPEGFRSAAEISGHMLNFLRQAYLREDPHPPDRVVVTVPASFQLPQREDTLKAARLAGLNLDPGDLLDEPVAAFIDYLIRHQHSIDELLRPCQNLLVFDFGGGTCDVAVIRLELRPGDRTLAASSVAVSRYHRLGGGDIDAAIVHQVLLPQLAEQRKLDLNDLDYETRKLYIEPALLSIAEALKIGLSMELDRLEKFGRHDREHLAQLHKRQPGRWPCPCPGYPDLSVESPTLTAAQFEQVLAPFLDRDSLYARETEYYLTQSIFAPLQDALDRAGLSPREVDLCLLVGGSSLIPQVRRAVKEYLGRAELLVDPDPETPQLAVARGAAWHALWLALFGRGFIQPVTHDGIALRTQSGLLELIPKGAALPYPAGDGWVERTSLIVPQTALAEPLKLRVEVVSSADSRTLSARTWFIPPPVNRGQPLRVRARMDANQCLQLELSFRDVPAAEPFACTIENPLSVVVNPHRVRQQIEEREERLRTSPPLSAEEIATELGELAANYIELGQYDKAISYLRQALRRKNVPDIVLLTRMAIAYQCKGDHERAVQAYREALRADPTASSVAFNLALTLYRMGEFEQARQEIQRALACERQAPYLVLLAEVQRKLGNAGDARRNLEEAFALFGPIESLDDWELYWYSHAAQLAGDDRRKAWAEQERKRRAQKRQQEVEGVLPDLLKEVMRR